MLFQNAHGLLRRYPLALSTFVKKFRKTIPVSVQNKSKGQLKMDGGKCSNGNAEKSKLLRLQTLGFHRYEQQCAINNSAKTQKRKRPNREAYIHRKCFKHMKFLGPASDV
jgi:hypothetical protein